MDNLVRAVNQVFTELNINRLADWKRLGGRASVGIPNSPDMVEPIWTDEQIGLLDNTTPPTLRNGQKSVVDERAVEVARSRFNLLLGSIKGPVQASRPSAWFGPHVNMKTGNANIIANNEVTKIPRSVSVSA